MSLSPAQANLLKFGVPIVAVLGLVAFLRSRSSSSPAASGTIPATTSAVDAGQLASFENAMSASLAALAAQISGSGGALPTSVPVTTGSSGSGGSGTTAVASISCPGLTAAEIGTSTTCPTYGYGPNPSDGMASPPSLASPVYVTPTGPYAGWSSASPDPLGGPQGGVGSTYFTQVWQNAAGDTFDGPLPAGATGYSLVTP